MGYKKFNHFKEPPILFSNRHKITDFDKTINNLPDFSSIIIREYDLKSKDREEFIKKLLGKIKNKKIKIIIAKDLNLAKKYKANGVHFSDNDKIPAKFFKKSSFKKDFILTVSCHSLKSLIKYSKYKIDHLFISPIFPTTSHNNSKTIGITKLAKISLKYKNLAYNTPKLFALGGISKTNIKKIKKTQISSFGAIDYFSS